MQISSTEINVVVQSVYSIELWEHHQMARKTKTIPYRTFGRQLKNTSKALQV